MYSYHVAGINLLFLTEFIELIWQKTVDVGFRRRYLSRACCVPVAWKTSRSPAACSSTASSSVRCCRRRTRISTETNVDRTSSTAACRTRTQSSWFWRPLESISTRPPLLMTLTCSSPGIRSTRRLYRWFSLKRQGLSWFGSSYPGFCSRFS